VEDWAEIRRLHRLEGMPIKAMARVMGCSRGTVRAALASDGPPRYERARTGSIVDPVELRIRELLQAYPTIPATVLRRRAAGPAAPVRLSCVVRAGAPPLPPSVPVLADRVGIDVEPLDLTDPDTPAWLAACVPPRRARSRGSRKRRRSPAPSARGRCAAACSTCCPTWSPTSRPTRWSALPTFSRAGILRRLMRAIAGSAGTATVAVHYATGGRIRSLPITLDHLL
jgi:uncharacterized protein DUF2332